MGGNGGEGDCPNLSQSVCAGTGVEPRVELVVCRAGRLAEMTDQSTPPPTGGVVWPVISVMICMDVSLSGSGTRL